MRHASYGKPFEVNPLAQAWIDWSAANIGEFDIAAVLHAPVWLADATETTGFEKLLRRALNQLDRYALGSLHRHQQLRLPRLVTIERAKGAGLHAHISIKLWKQDGEYVQSPAIIADEIVDIWKSLTKPSPEFASYCAYAQANAGHHLRYSLKHIGSDNWYSGQVDVLNSTPDALRYLQA